MQAQIRFTKSIYSTLRYHEHKEKLGVCECIAAGNFLKDLRELDFQDKQYHFQRLTGLNEAVTNRLVHISLTFHPSEKISNKEMAELAEEYVQRMKLANQPYLVYRHYDTPHPHMHVVLAGVHKDATRVHLTPADYYQSTNITRDITLKYHQVPVTTAEERKQRQGQALKVKYGQMPLRPAIGNVLRKVLHAYKYADLEGLNAVLKLWNVQAHRGKEDSEMYLNKGLAFRVLDDNGKPLLGHFKASGFDVGATLPKLEILMAQTLKEASRQQHRQRVTTLLEWHITKKHMDLPTLEKSLQREQISMVWMKDRRGDSEKLFYVDHSSRAVFGGHELGSGYEAATLRQRLPAVQVQEQKQVLQHRQRHQLSHAL
jgi:asparagine synthetase B (glutamine-hydrolysing)